MLRTLCTLLLLFGLPLLASGAKAENLLISFANDNSVKEYTTSGTYVRDFIPSGLGGLNRPSNLRFGPDGNLYVTSHTSIKKYEGTTGAYLGDFASGFSDALDIIFAPNGNAYVVDNATNSVSELSNTGTLLRTFTDKISTPEGIAFRFNGNLLVTNTYGGDYRQTVTEIDLITGISSTFGTGFGEPVGIAAGYDRRYYVANYGFGPAYRDTIQVIGQNGGIGTLWDERRADGTGYIPAPNYLVFTEGDLFVTAYSFGVVRFNGATGSFVSRFNVDRPIGVAVRNPISPFVSVGGVIALQGTQNAVQTLNFTFHPATGSDFTRPVVLNLAGGYNLYGIPMNQYTVSIKGAKWLRKNITVDARTGDVTNANAALLAGDANNDNTCDVSDLLLLIAHYNQVSPNAGYLDAADFNCDGVNDIADLLLLIANYNKQGN